MRKGENQRLVAKSVMVQVLVTSSMSDATPVTSVTEPIMGSSIIEIESTKRREEKRIVDFRNGSWEREEDCRGMEVPATRWGSVVGKRSGGIMEQRRSGGGRDGKNKVVVVMG